jgi:hypothetical protein
MAENTFASKFDNMHVLLWLIKDTCWMLEWRIFGTAMIAPTIGVAVFLAVRSRLERLFWINLAIWAGIPFAFGFAAVALFYLKPGTITGE